MPVISSDILTMQDASDPVESIGDPPSSPWRNIQISPVLPVHVPSHATVHLPALVSDASQEGHGEYVSVRGQILRVTPSTAFSSSHRSTPMLSEQTILSRCALRVLWISLIASQRSQSRETGDVPRQCGSFAAAE